MPRILTLAFTLLLLLPAAAQAGTYKVYTCSVAGKVWPNSAWKATHQSGVNVDASCGGGLIALRAPAGARMTNNTWAALTFTSPADTTITDFALTRQIAYTNPIAKDTHRYYVLYTLGGTHFAGAGNFHNPTRDRLNTQRHWYGHPESNVAIGRGTVTKSTFPALASYAGDANKLLLRVGCYNRGTPCSVASGGAVANILHGAEVTVNDPKPPTVTVEASGLLAGGSRHGSDPVTLTATDNAGIRRVELIDASNPAAPVVVGSEDYADVRTRLNRTCEYSRPVPCPALNRETITATSLQPGPRTLFVRVTDAGGNVVNRGPYSLYVVTPSDRGEPNGSNATDSGTLQLRWTTGGNKRRTLSYGRKAGIRGRLLNAQGTPITNAKVQLLTRDLREGANLVARKTLTTNSNGEFRTTVAATASRLLHFAWLAREHDVRFAANGYLTLKARAHGRLRTSTRRPRVGRSFTISGKLSGVSRGDVPVIVQGRARGAKRYSTFADTTTSRNGRFKVRYRFRDRGSRGRTFVFRARIRTGPRFPYETGYTRTVTVRVR